MYYGIMQTSRLVGVEARLHQGIFPFIRDALIMPFSGAAISITCTVQKSGAETLHDWLCPRLHFRPDPCRQIEQLEAVGCTTIFQETASGARTDRSQLKKAIATLPNNGVMIVTRLD